MAWRQGSASSRAMLREDRDEGQKALIPPGEGGEDGSNLATHAARKKLERD